MADIEAKLAALETAHEAGAITDEAYEEAQMEIISSASSAPASEPEPAPAEEGVPPEDAADAAEPEPEPEDAAETAEARAEAEREAAAAAEAEMQRNMAEIAQLAQVLTGKEAKKYQKKLSSSTERKIVKRGVLRKQGDVKISPRYFFLFNDLMLFCRFNEDKKKKKPTTYEPRKELSAEQLRGSTLKVLAAEPDMKDKELAFEMKTSGYETTLYAASVAEREEWIVALKDLVTGLQDDASSCGYATHHRLLEGTLHHAALVGDVGLAQRCMAPPRAPNLLDQVDQFGATALHVACFSGSDAVASMLVSEGAKTEMLDGDGRSPVHLAALGGHVDVISEAFTADMSVDLDVADAADTTPLQHALEAGNMGVASMLRRAGATPDRMNKGGWSGLHIAAQAGAADKVRQWIAVGADCNVRVGEAGGKHSGYTALLLAARAPADAAEATIQVLLENGADANAEAGGQTALALALSVDSTNVADFLVRRGAQFESLTLDEATAERFAGLHQEFLAAEERKRMVAESLAAAQGAQKLAADSVAAGW